MKINNSRHGYYFVLFMILVSISCNSVEVRYPVLNDVKLIELHICDQEITPSTNEAEIEQYCNNIFSSDNEELYLCGKVSGINDIDAHLGIFLYKDGFEKALFYNSLNDRFTNDYFCRVIPLPKNDQRIGVYTIEFHDARNVLDAIEFEVR